MRIRLSRKLSRRIGVTILSALAFLAFQAGRADETMVFPQACMNPSGYYYCQKDVNNPCNGIQQGCADIIRQGFHVPPPCDKFPPQAAVAMIFTVGGNDWTMCNGQNGTYPYECTTIASQCGTAELYAGNNGCLAVDFCGNAIVTACLQTADGQGCN